MNKNKEISGAVVPTWILGARPSWHSPPELTQVLVQRGMNVGSGMLEMGLWKFEILCSFHSLFHGIR